MFNCCGSSKQFNAFISFNDYIKAVAQKLMLEAVGNERYNAVHVRRGGM